MGSGGEGGSSGGGSGSMWADPNTSLLYLRAWILSWFGLDPNATLIDVFTGLPDFVKTAQTGQRLESSHIPLVSILGLHFINLAQSGHILSRT